MDTEVYFRNNVFLFGKVDSIIENNDSFLSFNLETRETWPDGKFLTEKHEVRYYKTPLKPELSFDAIEGLLVEVSGRVRLKDGSEVGYHPFIQCLKLNVLNS